MRFIVAFLIFFVGGAFFSALVDIVMGNNSGDLSGSTALIGLGISTFLAYRYLKWRSKVLTIKRNNREILVVPDTTDLTAVEGTNAKVDLSFLEKIFGPSSKTKWQWKLAKEKMQREEEERAQVRQYVAGHIEALQLNWQKSITEDEYGTKNYTKWISQLDRFFDSINYTPQEISREDALKVATYEVEISTDMPDLPQERTMDEKADQLILMGLVEKHKNALIRNWHKTVEQDDYGSRNLHIWHEEVGKFLSSVSFFPKAMNKDLAAVIVTAMVEDLVAGDNIESVFDFDEIISAYDFEEKCAEELSRAGWSTKVTSGSGDQGIDVLAEKETIRVVIQCKLYSKAVGNKAVQEAIAGKAFEKADYAAVVAPNGYTRSAKELAERDGVFLLSP